MTNDSVSFSQNFDKLKRISEEIKNQNEPNIDALVPKVDEALIAYAACKERIAAVKAILGEKLPEGVGA